MSRRAQAILPPMVFLESMETISLADFALMLGIAPDTSKRRVQRGQVETVDDPPATSSKRKLKRIRSDYTAAQLNSSRQDGKPRARRCTALP